MNGVGAGSEKNTEERSGKVAEQERNGEHGLQKEA